MPHTNVGQIIIARGKPGIYHQWVATIDSVVATSIHALWHNIRSINHNRYQECAILQGQVLICMRNLLIILLAI